MSNNDTNLCKRAQDAGTGNVWRALGELRSAIAKISPDMLEQIEGSLMEAFGAMEDAVDNAHMEAAQWIEEQD